MTSTPLYPDLAARRTLTISFVVTAVIGVAFIVDHWLRSERRDLAMLCGAVFLASMTAIHVLGYNLYRRQPIRWSPLYAPAARDAAIQFLLILVPTSTVLDGGGLLRTCFIVVISFWTVVAVMIARRPESPTHGDLRFIRLGALPLCTIALFYVTRLRYY